MEPKKMTAAGAKVGLSLTDVGDMARHVIHLVQNEGDTGIRLAQTALKLIGAVSTHDVTSILILFNAATIDVQEIIAAVKTEFQI